MALRMTDNSILIRQLPRVAGLMLLEPCGASFASQMARIEEDDQKVLEDGSRSDVVLLRE